VIGLINVLDGTCDLTTMLSAFSKELHCFFKLVCFSGKLVSANNREKFFYSYLSQTCARMKQTQEDKRLEPISQPLTRGEPA